MKVIIEILLALVLFHQVVGVRPQRNVLLHEAVRTLLGFKEAPLKRTKDILLSAGKEAPKYMLDLYSRFRNSQISKGHLSGNTVRSIQAEIADVNGEPMFVFNLSSVDPTERLLSSEIHLFKRKPKKHWRKKGDLELLMYEIAPHYMTENGKITMRANSYGWQWYDVTDASRSCLAARRDIPHLFALTFQIEKQSGKVKRLALKNFARHHSMPFLIIYSNDTQNIHLDHLDSLAEKLDKEKSQKDIISNTITSSDSSDNQNSDRTFEKSATEKVKSDKLDTQESNTRRKRSIFNNEIPEDPNDYKRFNTKRFNIPQTHPRILQTRKESRQKVSDPRLIPYPDNTQRKRNRRKNRKNRKNRRKNNRRRKHKLSFPKEWNDFQDNYHPTDNICGKRKLILDFADIGWEDWIIAPKSFEAHYCAGSCPFPLTKKLRPSNHATIQSMVHAIGIHADVPAPCCVPESMSSVTLLYFDESRNVVLKNYPSMSVNSCACR